MCKGFPIIHAYSILSTEPEIAITVLQNGIDTITAQAFFLGKMLKSIAIIHTRTAASCAEPEIAMAIFQDGNDPITT